MSGEPSEDGSPDRSDISKEPVALDITKDPVATPYPPPPPTAEPYDPEPLREQLRGWIAVGLLILLALVVAAALAALFLRIDSNSIKDVISLILSPIVGLVSAVTGFYYGSTKGR